IVITSVLCKRQCDDAIAAIYSGKRIMINTGFGNYRSAKTVAATRTERRCYRLCKNRVYRKVKYAYTVAFIYRRKYMRINTGSSNNITIKDVIRSLANCCCNGIVITSVLCKRQCDDAIAAIYSGKRIMINTGLGNYSPAKTVAAARTERRCYRLCKNSIYRKVKYT